MAYNCTGWNIANNCTDITVFGGYINMDLQDFGTRDVYFGTQIISVHASNTAKLIHCNIYDDPNFELTNNKGLTAAIATGTAVNHGLRTTPTNVMVTAAETGPTDVYVDTVGTTSFQINFGGGGNKTFYWQASVYQ